MVIFAGSTTSSIASDGPTELVDGLNGPLQGRVTGLAMDRFNGGRLFGVTDEGEFLLINSANGQVTRRFESPGTEFQGWLWGHKT